MHSSCTLRRPVTRNLQTKQVDVAQYLIPTRQSTLCYGGNCCNADYRASPFSLQQVNSSLTTVGQIQMTTFYFKLRSDQQRCTGSCCSSNIQKIWIDVGEHRSGWREPIKAECILPLPLPPCALAPAVLQRRALKQLATDVFVAHVQIDGSLLSLPCPCPPQTPNFRWSTPLLTVRPPTSRHSRTSTASTSSLGLASSAPSLLTVSSLWFGGHEQGGGQGLFATRSRTWKGEMRCLPVQVRSRLQATP